MTAPQTAGLPRMMLEPGETRVFLPGFVRTLTRLGLAVKLEEGYGGRAGLSLFDYRHGTEAVRTCTRAESLRQDLVFLLRAPRLEDVDLLGPDACLISMLHFPTRPRRVQMLRERGLRAISLDSIESDAGVRLVENMRAVAWNGMDVAFAALREDRDDRFAGGAEPVRVLILGSGLIGRHAVDAATKLGNVARNRAYMDAGGAGVIVLCAGRNLTANGAAMRMLFERTDILVDATQRSDPSRPVVPNDWLGWLPGHAVIADLAVDPYTLDTVPPVVRGIEGIPQGNLDKYLFRPDDADWMVTIPAAVPSRHRRTVVSCYSWPGIHAVECMEHYARQLAPMLEPLVRKGYDDLSPDGEFFERALYRASLRGWIAAAGDPG
jgi:alanine dehydrogenase